MEAGAQLEDRRDRALGLQNAAGGTRDVAQKLEQRALARAVLADDPYRLAACNLERDVFKRGEDGVARNAGNQLDEPVDRARVEVVLLRQSLRADSSLHRQHSTELS